MSDDGYCRLSAAGTHRDCAAACYICSSPFSGSLGWLTLRQKDRREPEQGAPEITTCSFHPIQGGFRRSSCVKDIFGRGHPRASRVRGNALHAERRPGRGTFVTSAAHSAVAQTVLSLTETHHGLAGSGRGKQEEALRDEDRKVGGQLSVPKRRVPIGAVIAETRAFHLMRLSALPLCPNSAAIPERRHLCAPFRDTRWRLQKLLEAVLSTSL